MSPAPRIPSSVCWIILAGYFLACHATPAAAATRYHVDLQVGKYTGLQAGLAVDLLSPTTAGNQAQLLAFTHDGKAESTTYVGGPIVGDLLDGANPADTTIVGGAACRNGIVVPFDSVGSSIEFDVAVTEIPPTGINFEDAASCYLLRSFDQTPYPTADPLGTAALFAISVTGAAGGDLSVFAPMEFIPPDTLRLTGTLVGVQAGTERGERLRFLQVAPNPAVADIQLSFYVPNVSGAVDVSIYDVAGRRVFEMTDHREGRGTRSLRWDGRDSAGKQVPSGLYLITLRLNGQTAVRHLLLRR